MTRRFKFVILKLVVSLSACAAAASAQQTIFNIPSADVLDRGKVYTEFDTAFKPNSQISLGRFSSFVPRVVVGVGGNVEVGVNLTGNIQPGNDTTTLVPNVKFRFYQSSDKKTSVFAGGNLFVPIRNRAYRVGGYIYAAATRSFRKTRVTGGMFVFSRSVVTPKAVRGGGQFAVERSFSDKFSLAADWLTGKHANGYFTPGAIYKPRPDVTVYAAYSIGNSGAKIGNHFFLIELGYNF